MTREKVNDKYKDALFRIVFGDYPENALSLYNAVNGTSYTNADELEITTLRDAIYIGIKNDISFLFNHDMNLYEHQSTYSPNMPLRGLGYFADLYQIHLGGEEYARERIYSRYPVDIPAPRFYVFYNGADERADREDLHLSSLYGGEGDIEVTAHMINVNVGHNIELLESCKPLYDVSEFVSRVRVNRARGYSKEDAVEMAVDSCIEDNVLGDILRKERSRVTNALITGLTEEEIERLRAWETEHSHELGYNEGCENERLQAIRNVMKNMKTTAEEAMNILDIPAAERDNCLAKL